MSQTPITVTYDIKELFTNLERNIGARLDRFEKRIDDRFEKVDQRFDKLEEKVNKLEIGQVELKSEIKKLDEKLSVQIAALDKRIDNQEILNRITLGGVIVVILGGAAKMFGWLPNP